MKFIISISYALDLGLVKVVIFFYLIMTAKSCIYKASLSTPFLEMAKLSLIHLYIQ